MYQTAEHHEDDQTRKELLEKLSSLGHRRSEASIHIASIYRASIEASQRGSLWALFCGASLPSSLCAVAKESQDLLQIVLDEQIFAGPQGAKSLLYADALAELALLAQACGPGWSNPISTATALCAALADVVSVRSMQLGSSNAKTLEALCRHASTLKQSDARSVYDAISSKVEAAFGKKSKQLVSLRVAAGLQLCTTDRFGRIILLGAILVPFIFVIAFFAIGTNPFETPD